MRQGRERMLLKATSFSSNVYHTLVDILLKRERDRRVECGDDLVPVTLVRASEVLEGGRRELRAKASTC